MSLTLTDLLAKAGIDGSVLVMRHAPPEPALRAAFPLIGRNDDRLLDAYQGWQMGKAQPAARRANWLVGCSGEAPGEAVFLGVWRIEGWREVARADYQTDPALQELENAAGGWLTPSPDTATRLDLLPDPRFAEYRGRLVLGWAAQRSWYQWLEPDRFPIRAYVRPQDFDPPLPDWRAIDWPFKRLRLIPKGWWTALAQWRAVYLITDTTDGRGYVGSASGAQNLAGRWQTYRDTGDGGNGALRGLDPARFRFSILEIMRITDTRDDLVRCEERWKRRLMVRELGLNGRDPKDKQVPLPEDAGGPAL